MYYFYLLLLFLLAFFYGFFVHRNKIFPFKIIKALKDFVRKRRVRNRTVSFMYWNFFIGFVVSMSFITNLLKLILY